MSEIAIREEDSIAKIVKRISLRGMEFEYHYTGIGEHIISSTSHVEDTDDESVIVMRTCSVRLLGSGYTEKYIVDVIRSMAISHFTHEVDELFRVDGKAIFNPHKTQKEAI